MKCCVAPRALVPCALLLLSLGTIAGHAQSSSSTSPTRALPAWAYVVPPPPPPPGAPDQTPRHVPGSSQTYTTAFVASRTTVPDWFPNDHPAMPEPVRQGKGPTGYACGYCHLPNALGRPENESLAGLPKAYIIAQLKDFQDGSRRSSEPRMDSVTHMIEAARAVTPEETAAAADYFSQLKLTKWIKVVETDTVPKTHISSRGMLFADPGTEPIGSRIIETPVDPEQAELRNGRSGFIAYVPKGSLKTGEALVKTGGNGETIACTICHGPDLRGIGDIPGIAGRSPSAMTRQLIDIKDGARNGSGDALMKLPVSKLTEDDIVAITAYLASLEP